VLQATLSNEPAFRSLRTLKLTTGIIDRGQLDQIAGVGLQHLELCGLVFRGSADRPLYGLLRSIAPTLVFLKIDRIMYLDSDGSTSVSAELESVLPHLQSLVSLIILGHTCSHAIIRLKSSSSLLPSQCKSASIFRQGALDPPMKPGLFIRAEDAIPLEGLSQALGETSWKQISLHYIEGEGWDEDLAQTSRSAALRRGVDLLLNNDSDPSSMSEYSS
jgi:hypothetical protein